MSADSSGPDSSDAGEGDHPTDDGWDGDPAGRVGAGSDVPQLSDAERSAAELLGDERFAAHLAEITDDAVWPGDDTTWPGQTS